MSDRIAEIHINMQGRVIVRYEGGKCVDVTDTRGRKLYSAQAQAGDGEAVGEVFEVLCEGRIVYVEVYDGAVIPHRAKIYTRPQPAVNQQDLIDLLIATRTQSEGVTADLIIKMIDAKPAVNQQLMEALKKAESHLHAMMAHIYHKPRRFQKHCWQQVFDIRAAISAAQEQGK